MAGRPGKYSEEEVERAMEKIIKFRDFCAEDGDKEDGPLLKALTVLIWALGGMKAKAYNILEFVNSQDEEMKSWHLRQPPIIKATAQICVKYRAWHRELRFVIEPMVKSIR